MRVFTTLCEVCGAALLVAAAGMVAVPFGFAAGGVCLVGVGWLLGRDL